ARAHLSAAKFPREGRGGTAIAPFEDNAGQHHRERPPNDPVGTADGLGHRDRESNGFIRQREEKDWGFFSGLPFLGDFAMRWFHYGAGSLAAMAFLSMPVLAQSRTDREKQTQD